MGTADRACAAAFVSGALFFAFPASSAPANAPSTHRDEGPDKASPADVQAGGLPTERAMVVAIDWRRAPGAEGCIDGPTLEREVEGRLERRVFGNAMEADVFLHGQVERRDADFVARLSMVAANGRVLGERELRSDAPDCARLDESLAVVIALALDSIRAMPAASLRVPKASPRERWAAKVGPTFVGSWGLLPDPSMTVGFDVSLQPPTFWPIDFAWSIGLVPTKVERSGRTAEFSSMQFGLFLCPLSYVSRVELRACFGTEADYLSATGVTFDVQRSTGSWVVGPSTRTVLFLPIGRAAGFSSNFNLAVPLLRDRFTYTSDGGSVEQLHQPAPIVLFLGIGLLLRIP
jgi:hypothetical protein